MFNLFFCLIFSSDIENKQNLEIQNRLSKLENRISEIETLYQEKNYLFAIEFNRIIKTALELAKKLCKINQALDDLDDFSKDLLEFVSFSDDDETKTYSQIFSSLNLCEKIIFQKFHLNSKYLK